LIALLIIDNSNNTRNIDIIYNSIRFFFL